MLVVVKRAYPAGTRDFNELVATLKSAAPDVVIGGTALLDSTALVREARSANFAPKLFFLTTGPAQPAFYQELGVLAENIMGNTEWEPALKAPGVDTFVKAYRDQYYEMPSYHAAGAYAAGQVLEAVVRKVGNLDRERLRDGFARTAAETIFGQYLVDRSGTQFAKPNFVIQWRDANRVVVWPETYTDVQPKLPFVWK
jgi:branched-chain amino acid transport system substrate-binding protein